jgi:hypothetical protein
MNRNARGMVKSNSKQTGKCNARTFAVLALALAISLLLRQDASAAAPASTDSTSSATLTTTAPRTMQSGRDGGFKHPAQRRTNKSSVETRVNRLAKQLGLTEVQSASLKQLLDSRQAETNRLWNDQKVDPIERMNKLRTLRENTRKQFEAMLNEDQKKKYQALVQQVARENAAQQPTDKSTQPQAK